MKRFVDFLNEAKEDVPEDISDEELEQLANELDWEDIADLYDDEELVGEDEEELEEAISASARLRRGQQLRARKSKVAMARKMKLRRPSDTATLQKRARHAARRLLMKRFLKGRNKASLSAAEKDRVEQQVRNMPAIVATLSSKLVNRIRSIERKRLSKGGKR